MASCGAILRCWLYCICGNMDSELGLVDRFEMLRGIINPDYFRQKVRPLLYAKAGNDAEEVQELVIRSLHNSDFYLKLLSGLFRRPRELMVNVNGVRLMPFGTAAGLDKDGAAMLPLSRIFGFLEPGTVMANPREGNAKPRLASADADLDLYNAMGFPSRGLENFLINIKDYRKKGGSVPVYASICGLPLSETDAIKVAMEQMRTLVQALSPYVDGFVWNPASPNTTALGLLRTKEVFRATAELIADEAPSKLRMVKMWPYEPGAGQEFTGFVGSFIEGGGHGVVVTNTKMVPGENVPSEKWGYKSAGRSGRFLKEYRLRAVRDARSAFPKAVVVATGGIYDGEDAYQTFKAGADMIEGYTPYAFYGLGLLNRLVKGVCEGLRKDGYGSLQKLQSEVKANAGE